MLKSWNSNAAAESQQGCLETLWMFYGAKFQLGKSLFPVYFLRSHFLPSIPFIRPRIRTEWRLTEDGAKFGWRQIRRCRLLDSFLSGSWTKTQPFGEDFTVKLSSLFRSMSHSAFHKRPRGATVRSGRSFPDFCIGFGVSELRIWASWNVLLLQVLEIGWTCLVLLRLGRL